jgi:hypothetical protein
MVSSLAINKTAAARILPFATRVESVRQLRNGAIQVTYRVAGGRRCSTFVSRKAFERDFIEFRQLGAQSVSVKPWGAGTYQNHYECRTAGGDRIHNVKLLGYAVNCSCEDYEHQSDKVGLDALCKHGIAVLNYLGYGSISAYTTANLASTTRLSLVSTQIERETKEALASLWANY